MNQKKAEIPFDFEKGMQRLEEIIAQFDEGGLPLDRMESFFVEGMELIKNCSERLDRVERRVTELLNDPQSGWSERPLEDNREDESR